MAVIDRTDQRRQGPPPYVFQAWPSWRYSAECPEGQIFHSEDEVPEGWVDHPSKIGKPKPHASESVSDDDETVQALVDAKSQKELVAIIETANEDRDEKSQIEFLPGWPKLRLAKTIVASGVEVDLTEDEED